MKEINFRIIELPEHQILLTKDFDDEEELEDDEESKPLLVVTFFVEDLKVNQKFGFSDDNKRDKAFENFTDAQAQSLIDSAIQMMTDTGE